MARWKSGKGNASGHELTGPLVLCMSLGIRLAEKIVDNSSVDKSTTAVIKLGLFFMWTSAADIDGRLTRELTHLVPVTLDVVEGRLH